MFDPLSIALVLMGSVGTIFVTKVLGEASEEIGAAAGTGEERTASARTALVNAETTEDFQRELSNYERSLVAAQLSDDTRRARLVSAIEERSNTLDIESKIPEGFAAPNELRTETIKRFQGTQVSAASSPKSSADPTGIGFDKQVEARMFAQNSLGSKFTPEAANVLLNATEGIGTKPKIGQPESKVSTETQTPQELLDRRAFEKKIEPVKALTNVLSTADKIKKEQEEQAVRKRRGVMKGTRRI